jgi:hypothetical protein
MLRPLAAPLTFSSMNSVGARLKSQCCCLLVIGLSLRGYHPLLAYPENNHECQISLIFLREWVAIRSHALPRGPGWKRR